jgi:hemolysin III
MFKSLREPVSGLTHFIAALAAIVGLVVLLVIGGDDVLKQRSLLVYGTSLVLMLAASASYHLILGSPARIGFLRKIDHASIYILIAGTYTPVFFNQFAGFWKWGMLALIWSLALVGSITKIFMMDAPRWLTAGVYLVMGWLSLLAVGEILRVLPAGALIWLLLGGASFTLGAVVYATKAMDFVPGVFGFHEVWHIFVVVGALCHYVAILIYIAPVPRSF